MQKLRKDAELRSGVPFEAVEKARSANLYQRLGMDMFKKLSTAFYERVYSDEQWFREIFSSTTREAATRNQYEFLVEEFGGPPLYTSRKGHTALLGRHAPYPITHAAASRWVEHMKCALDSVPEIDDAVRENLFAYFQHMASFVVYGIGLLNPSRTVGYFGKHHEGGV